MYALHRPFADITQITLPKPGLPPLFGTPANVYVVHGDAPALVGTGHPSAQGALNAALSDVGLRRRDIERIVALDWSPDQLGAADAFPNADVFALDRHGGAVREYGHHLSNETKDFLRIAEYIVADERYAEVDLEPLAQQAKAYFTGPVHVDVIAIPGGRELRLGGRSFRVGEAPGVCPGHAVLWSAPDKLLFSSRAVIERSFGRAIWRDVAAYVGTLEQLHDLEPKTLLPTFGRVDDDARYAVTRAHRAVTGLLGHLPFSLKDQVTLAGLMWLDFGRVVSQHARLVETARSRLACLDYLAATNAIDREGDGPKTRYGATVPVTRSMIG